MDPKKEKILSFLIIFINLFMVGVFLFSLIIMTTDGQGVFIFLFTIPLIFILFIISLILSKKIKQSQFNFVRFTKYTILSIFLFCLFGLIPVLKEIPIRSLNGLIHIFKSVTGKTPRQYFHDRNDLLKLMQGELDSSGGQQIIFSKIKTAHHWSKVCIFTPYTSDEVANEKVGLQFKLSLYSTIASSDSIHVVALFDDRSLVNYVNLSRSVMDFSFNDSVCLSKESAVLKKKDQKFSF